MAGQPPSQLLTPESTPTPPPAPQIPSQSSSQPLSQSQSQPFLFVSNNDPSQEPRKRKDWKVIRSHVMSHWHQQARDDSLSRLKGGIMRPGDKPQTDEGGRKTSAGRRADATPTIEGLCGKFESQPRPKPKGRGKGISGNAVKREKQEARGKGVRVTYELSSEGYGSYEIDQFLQKTGVGGLQRESTALTCSSSSSDETSSESSIQLDRFPGAFKIDPFATTAVPMNKRADEMIFHYSTMVLPSLYPCKNPAARTNAYFQTVLSNPMILCAKIAMAFTNSRFISMSPFFVTSDLVNASCLQRGDLDLQQEWLKYKTRVMTMVNKSLVDESENVGNATLHTIITLSAIAHFAGNAAETTVHHRAALRIVKLRGGIKTLPGHILESLAIVDLFLATATSLPPLIPHDSLSGLLAFAATSPAGIAFDAAKPPVPKAFTILLTPDLFTPTTSTVIVDFYKLLALIDKLDDVPNIAVEFWSQLPLQTFYVGYRLCAAVPLTAPLLDADYQPYPNLLDEGYELPTPLQECVRLSLLLFLHTTLVKSNPHLYMIRHLISQLQTSLFAANVPSDLSFPTSNTNVLLWILFVGALGSRGEIAHPWFLGLIRGMLAEMEIGTWEEAKGVLRRFLWSDKELNVGFRWVWEKAEMGILKREKCVDDAGVELRSKRWVDQWMRGGGES